MTDKTEVHQRLVNMGYREYERWRIDEVLNFVRRELDEPDWTLRVVLILLLGGVVFGITAAYWDIEGGQRWFYDIVLPFGIGCLAMFVVVIPHELIHGIAYRLTGARNILYGGNLRQLVFHASAPYHAVSAKQLYFVALAPFVIITLTIVVGLVLTTGPVWWALFGLLLMHTQGCVGDFAMVSFFNRNSDRGAWMTYDASDTEEFVLLLKDDESLV